MMEDAENGAAAGPRSRRPRSGATVARSLDDHVAVPAQPLARRRSAPDRGPARAPADDHVSPDDLPVSGCRDEITQALLDHQVVVAAGETGSGKTTQLPKICPAAGRGINGMIGHTQPRRIAATSVAQRIADETGTELGEAVGYCVRFSDRVSPLHAGQR